MRKNAKRKAQLQMGESIMVLIIFFFLLIFGIVFYASYSYNKALKNAREARELIAVQIVQKVQFLPEIQCTIEGNEDYNCVDKYKLDTFDNLEESRKRIYRAMFPRAKIDVKQVYPSEDEWHIYGEELTDKNVYYYPIPVSIFDPIEDYYAFGYLEIKVYI